jgi:hypothetical protein
MAGFSGGDIPEVAAGGDRFVQIDHAERRRNAGYDGAVSVPSKRFNRGARGTLCSLARPGRRRPVTSRSRRVAAFLSCRCYVLVNSRSLLMRLSSALVCLDRPSQRRLSRTSGVSCALCRHLRAAPEVLQFPCELGVANSGGVSSLSRSLGPSRRRAGCLLWGTLAPVHSDNIFAERGHWLRTR